MKYVDLPDILGRLLDWSNDTSRHIEDPGIELFSLGVHQEQRGSVSIDQLLSLVHDLENQGVHGDHLLKYGSRKKFKMVVFTFILTVLCSKENWLN